MSLHVDLLLDSERRSGSNVSKKFVIQVVAVVAPLALVLTLVSFYFVSHQAKARAQSLQESWTRMETTQKVVHDIEDNFNLCRKVADDMVNWRDSNIRLSELIMTISEAVPKTIQLTRLVTSDGITTINGKPGRSGTMFIRGKVGGLRPDEDVQNLSQNIEKHPDINSSQVMRYEAETAKGGRSPTGEDTRIFDMECRYKTRMIR